MKLYRSFESKAELDAQYDVDSVVPEFPIYVERLFELSDTARGRLTPELDLRYGPTLDERLDVFSPTRSGPSPVIVYFHGGYWRLLTGREFHFVALGLVERGFTVVIPTYSLAPKVSVDEIVRQARAALAWTWTHIDGFGGDLDRIWVGGHSAGAQLAVMTALTHWHDDYGLPDDLVAGVLAGSGLYDLRPLRHTVIGPSLRLDSGQIRRNSPQLLELPDHGPPLLATWGSRETEEFRRQSRDFLARWVAAGLPGQGFEQRGCDHFAAVLELADPESALTRAITDFVGAQRHPAAA